MTLDAIIIGLDEAGRGAVAGPVVAGACYLPPEAGVPDFITDSKKLTEKQRNAAYEWLCGNAVIGAGFVEAAFIDSDGILAATEKAMQEALAVVAKEVTPTYLLIDGRDHFWFDYPHSSVIKGDEKEPCISAGSIVAKVSRDRFMIEQAAQYPAYDFASNKGYGTEKHMKAITQTGPSPFHRETFLQRILSGAVTAEELAATE